MRLVVDANILFAACLPRGLTARILVSEEVELYAPEFILVEFAKHEPVLRSRTGADINQVMNVFMRWIQMMPHDGSILEIPDTKDLPYLALAQKLQCPLWSNDKALKKQTIVEVLTTEELLLQLKR